MDEQEKKQEAQALREKLRNERNISRDAGNTSIGKSSGSTDASFGSDSENIRGYTGTPSRDAKGTGGNDRSTQSSSKRSGQNNGRSLDYGGSSTDRSDQTSRYSGLERADPVPEMLPVKRPVGRPRKEQVIDTAVSVKKAIFKKKSPLTEKEAEEYKKSLMNALQAYGEYYDKYIRWKTQQVTMPEIWGNITDFEAEAMANIMIRRGMKNAQAAEAVRAMVNGDDYVSVGVMFIPRIMATVEEMKKAPPKQRKRKGRETAN